MVTMSSSQQGPDMKLRRSMSLALVLYGLTATCAAQVDTSAAKKTRRIEEMRAEIGRLEAQVKRLQAEQKIQALRRQLSGMPSNGEPPRLIGIQRAGGERQAVFAGSSGPIGVSVGDRVAGGWTLEGLTASEVTLRRGEESVSLALGEGGRRPQQPRAQGSMRDR